jgi:SPP1 family predicted phage head-tail adaptor
VRAGALRHRVTFQHRVTTRDADGAVAETWFDVFPNIPANIVPLSAREFVAGGEVQGEVQARIELRYMPGILDTMRAKHGATVYAIKGVLPDNKGGRRWLNVMVSGGVTSE